MITFPRFHMACLPLICGLMINGISAATAAEPQNSTGQQVSTNETSEPTSPEIANGQATHKWLDVQGSGAQASKLRQTLTGPVLRKISERYENSFGAPIPEKLPQAGISK